MKLSQIPFLALMSFCAITATSCKDDKEEPVTPVDSQPVAEAILGKWLLASSDAEEWIVYDFKDFQMSAQWKVNGTLLSGTGSYFTNNENASLTGTIADDRNNHKYLDWRITGISTFQINLNVYGDNGNQLIGPDALYKIVGAQEAESGSRFTPDYRVFTGTPDCTDFYSIDNTVATVNATSGEVECVGEGSTFVVFSTPAGKGVITVSVTDRIMSLLENLQGTWVADVKGVVWEKDLFGPDGYFYAQWSRDVIFPTADESAQGTYSVNESAKTVSIDARTPYGLRLLTEYRITSIDRYSFNADIYSGGDKSGALPYQKILESVTLEPGATYLPDYSALVGSATISGFATHEGQRATVDPASGLITAVSRGLTYIDVKTPKGTGVIEVNVEGGAIPYSFEKCIGKGVDRLHEMLGDNPYYEDETTVIYRNLTDKIEQVGVSLDAWTGTVRGLTISYGQDLRPTDVTSILDATFIPLQSQTTDVFKAYMDSDKREDATVGVTWDINSRVLTYVNLATDLFRDYSLLLGMTSDQVIAKIGQSPDISDEQSQTFFFFDQKGVAFVSAYYTDFVSKFDTVQSVAVKLDDTLADDKVTAYLNKKYNYYPEHSTEKELVFISKEESTAIYFLPEDRLLMYFPLSTNRSVRSRTDIVDRIRRKAFSRH